VTHNVANFPLHCIFARAHGREEGIRTQSAELGSIVNIVKLNHKEEEHSKQVVMRALMEMIGLEFILRQKIL
jgi:hypothetical protein